MADFNVNVEGPQGGQQAAAPVQRQQADLGLNLFSQVGGVVAKAALDYSTNQQAVKQQEAINSNTSNFAQAQLRIASAVDTGDMTSQEGRMRMRANYTRAIADNPGMVGDLAKVHKDIVSTSGLGKVVAEGTEQEQMNLAAEKEASLAGWVPAHLDAQGRQEATQAHLQFKRAQEDLKAEAARVNLQSAKINQQSSRVGLASAQVGLQSAKIGLMQKERSERSRAALGSIADTYNYKFSQDLDEIRIRHERGEITGQEATLLADQQYATIAQVTSRIGGDADAEYLGNITAPMRMRYENTKKFLNGDIDKQVLENQNFIATAKQKQIILGNPDTAKTIAVSQLLPNAQVTLMPALNDAVVKIMSANNNPESKPADILPDNDSDKKDTKVYLDLLKHNMSGSNAGTLVNKDEATAELDINLSNVLKGIDAYSLTASNPGEYNQVVDFLASPEFGKYTTMKGGIPADQATSAKQVLQSNYENQVLPLLKKAWEDSKTGNTRMSDSARAFVGLNAGDSNTAEVIKPTFTGSGISFQVAPGITDSRTRNKAKDLNTQVAPILNRLIRMSAHLEGTQDYKRVYNDNYSAIFGEEKPTEEVVQ